MVALPSLHSRSGRAPGVRSGARYAVGPVEQDVDRARIALEERYLVLMATRNPASADELFRVRTHLHKLAEINGDATAPARDTALRTWLRTSP